MYRTPSVVLLFRLRPLVCQTPAEFPGPRILCWFVFGYVREGHKITLYENEFANSNIWSSTWMNFEGQHSQEVSC